MGRAWACTGNWLVLVFLTSESRVMRILALVWMMGPLTAAANVLRVALVAAVSPPYPVPELHGSLPVSKRACTSGAYQW